MTSISIPWCIIGRCSAFRIGRGPTASAKVRFRRSNVEMEWLMSSLSQHRSIGTLRFLLAIRTEFKMDVSTMSVCEQGKQRTSSLHHPGYLISKNWKTAKPFTSQSLFRPSMHYCWQIDGNQVLFCLTSPDISHGARWTFFPFEEPLQELGGVIHTFYMGGLVERWALSAKHQLYR